MCLELSTDFINTDLVGNVMDGDVMHGRSVTLEQSMKVSPTVSETEKQAYNLYFPPSKFHLYNICEVHY